MQKRLNRQPIRVQHASFFYDVSLGSSELFFIVHESDSIALRFLNIVPGQNIGFSRTQLMMSFKLVLAKFKSSCRIVSVWYFCCHFWWSSVDNVTSVDSSQIFLNRFQLSLKIQGLLRNSLCNFPPQYSLDIQRFPRDDVVHTNSFWICKTTSLGAHVEFSLCTPRSFFETIACSSWLSSNLFSSCSSTDWVSQCIWRP